jgi:hypothetical protein
MGPVRELRDYLELQSEQNPGFDARLRDWMTREQQWNFDRGDPDSWRKAIDRAARSMVYVLSNRVLFYQAVRLRNDLSELEFPRRARKDPKRALEYLHECFEEAVEKTGDYEPVFFPEEKEWAALMALSGTNSLDAWDKTIRAIDRFNFKEIRVTPRPKYVKLQNCRWGCRWSFNKKTAANSTTQSSRCWESKMPPVEKN